MSGLGLFDDEIDAERVEIAATLLEDRERAFKIDAGNRVLWIPKSQGRYDADRKVALVATWFAEKEGLL